MPCQEILARKVCKALAIAGTHTPGDVEKAIEAGTMQHWEEDETIVVTTVNQYPQAKACEVFMVAGDFETAWKIHDEQIVPWAKSIGCTRMVGRGRLGWIRDLEQRGYRRQWIMASREI